jgi:hypothetical protein
MSPTRHRSIGGFSVVESTVAIVVGVLVLGAAVGLLLWGSTSFRRTEDRLDARERAHQAFVMLRQVFVDAVAYGQDGDDLVFCGLRGKGVVHFDSKLGRLSIKYPGQSRFQDLVSSGVLGFSVLSPNPGVLRLGIELARPGGSGRLKALPNLRVYDEIFIPAVALRYDPLPWNSAGRA